MNALAIHLIKAGMTFNAEDPNDPVITRPVRLEELVSVIEKYLAEKELQTSNQ